PKVPLVRELASERGFYGFVRRRERASLKGVRSDRRAGCCAVEPSGRVVVRGILLERCNPLGLVEVDAKLVAGILTGPARAIAQPFGQPATRRNRRADDSERDDASTSRHPSRGSQLAERVNPRCWFDAESYPFWLPSPLNPSHHSHHQQPTLLSY